jgi:hypothetical protein
MSQRIQELVEELRSTGYHGRDTWLPSIDRREGTTIAAIRQLEVCASQMVSPWFDAVMDEQELWSFLRSHFSPRLLALEEIIESNSVSLPIRFDAGDLSFRTVWAVIRRWIKGIGGVNEQPDYGNFVVTFMVSVMVLRQLVEVQNLESTAGDRFVCESTNVAGAFLLQCFAKAGFRPFQVADGASLRQLAERIDNAASNSTPLDVELMENSGNGNTLKHGSVCDEQEPIEGEG